MLFNEVMLALLLLLVVSVAVLTGCAEGEKPSALAAAQAAPTGPVAPVAPFAPVREQMIDTDVGPPAKVAPQPSVREPHEAPNNNRKVRTPADDALPPWVPISGRLTVVESSDLAENLGLVPMGSAKNSAAPISVAEKLAEENAARAAIAEATRGPTSWTYIPGGTFVSYR